jgi:hypothetical protein
VGLRQPGWMTESCPRVFSPGRRWSPIVGEHAARLVGDLSFQATHGFIVGLAGCDLGVARGTASACSHAYLGECDDVQREVGLAVPALRAGVLAWRRPPRWGPRRPQVQTEAFYPRVLSGAPSSAVSGNRCKVHLFPLAGGFRWRSEVQSARDGLNELGDDHLRQPISDWARTDGFHWPA